MRIEPRVWGVLWSSTNWYWGELTERTVSSFRGVRPEMAAVNYPNLKHKRPKCTTDESLDSRRNKTSHLKSTKIIHCTESDYKVIRTISRLKIKTVIVR